MKPVYEFRPLPDFFIGEVRRYANGQWIPDDGEFDLAFIGMARSETFGYPCCLMVEHSHQKNIVGKWTSNGWQQREQRHRGGNPWHYALADGESEWGGDWGLYNHENRRAGDSGMNKMCAENGCSNGRHVSLTEPEDPHVLAGLVRLVDTKEIFRLPESLVCMYCGDKFQHKAEREASCSAT